MSCMWVQMRSSCGFGGYQMARSWRYLILLLLFRLQTLSCESPCSCCVHAYMRHASILILWVLCACLHPTYPSVLGFFLLLHTFKTCLGLRKVQFAKRCLVEDSQSSILAAIEFCVGSVSLQDRFCASMTTKASSLTWCGSPTY